MPKVRAPRVIDGELKDSKYPAPIVVGRPFWFEWLDSHESFHFEDREGKFTAVRTRGYWTAHRRVKGKLYRHYLGVSQDLTLNKLCEAAKEISIAVQNNTSSSLVNQSRNPIPEKMDYETDCETKGTTKSKSSSQPSDEIAKLKARIAELENQEEELLNLQDENMRLQDENAKLKQKFEGLPEREQEMREEINRLMKLQLENDSLKTWNQELRAALKTNSSADPATLFNQLRPLLNRLSDRERRAIQQKLVEIVDT